MRIACIGECMLELSEAAGGALTRAYGGDTLNTAVYLARLGVAVDYCTVLGDDPFSREMLAGWRAVREYDLKLILAFGTVSQLGLITVLVGSGGGDLMLAGLTMLCAHAMFKAALFMVVGIVDHATGTRDIRRLAWLGHRMPALFVIAAGATASMAALPPFLGFVAKEADFETLLHSPSLGPWAPWVLAGVVAASVFTTIYSLRFLWGAFARKGLRSPSARVAQLHRPSISFQFAPAVLAAAGLFFGLVPNLLERLLDPYAESLPGGADYHLALWHGLNLPLVLSAVVLLVGTASFVARARLPRAGGRWLPLGNADRIYDIVDSGREVSFEDRAAGRRTQIRSVWRAVSAVDEIFARCGGNAARMDKPLQRYWRDVHVGHLHAIHVPSTVYHASALSSLGVDPEGPLRAMI